MRTPRNGDDGLPDADDLLFFPDDPIEVDDDRHPIAKPRETDTSEIMEAIQKSIGRPPEWDHPSAGYAVNVNTLGEVPDSTWFTNRQGEWPLTAAQLHQGPDRSGPPASGVWHITGAVGEGVMEKFRMRDPTGREFIVKLESVDYPELASSAEVICTKFFYSLGYNVPENYVVTFLPEQLQIEEDSYPEHDLRERLEETPKTPDGQVRAMASLLLEGEPVGPFRYQGVREDDPNDIFPHQHRRELRGLRVFAAWLSHTDVKDGNSLDTFIPEEEESGAPGEEQDHEREQQPAGAGEQQGGEGEQQGGEEKGELGYVRHHLIDFGSCLGSAATDAKDHITGYEYYVDPAMLMKGILTLGMWLRPYVTLDFPESPALGRIEADYYEPWRWMPPIPNPAFRLMDAADAFWGAKIAARYTQDDIRTIVSAGRLTDPRAEAQLVDILVRRQQKTVAYWLTRTNPLDEFAVRRGGGGDLELTFANAALREDLVRPPISYTHRWFRLDNRGGGSTTPVGGEEPIIEADGAEAALVVPEDPWGPADPFGMRYAVVEVATRHPVYPHWDRPVVVTLRDRDGDIEVVGVRRPREMPPGPDDVGSP